MSSHHSRSPTSTGKIDRLSEVTLSGGQQTYESFGSRTTSVKTLSVSTSKPPSPTLIGEGSASVSGYQAVTGNSASNSVHSSSANIASDLVRLATSGKLSFNLVLILFETPLANRVQRSLSLIHERSDFQSYNNKFTVEYLSNKFEASQYRFIKIVINHHLIVKLFIFRFSSFGISTRQQPEKLQVSL